VRVLFFRSVACIVRLALIIGSSLCAASEHPDGECQSALRVLDARALRSRIRASRNARNHVSATEQLLRAVHHGDIEGAGVALYDSANVDARYYSSGDRVLIHAIRGRHNEMVQLLLDSKASVVGRDGANALYVAMECFGHVDSYDKILKMLIFAGAEYKQKARVLIQKKPQYDWWRDFREYENRCRKVRLFNDRVSEAVQILVNTQGVKQAVDAYDRVSAALGVHLPDVLVDIVIRYALSECYDPVTRAEMLRTIGEEWSDYRIVD